AELPAKIEGKNFCVVHGTPADPVKEYFTNDAQFYANAPLWKGQVCFVGHTHLPFYMEGTTEDCLVSLVSRPEQVIPLASHARYVINPGAVGKPRDKNPQAAFGIWDNSKNTFQFLREPYDVQKTQEKMRKLNFPDFLIESLAIGY
ncbi:MAG: metallophosphoesterase family protein, partial [Elusimicrobiaceae bacterium]|nr:metallophosphoesterase family protein [Elusimicrobiaceae bacterium]